ncbi:helix-turn-helix domain-containing protein [Desulfosporosinus sp. BICA1-9]|uniref:helix-turn-helix domain-containing protein n=1 Tax=Desulfosporosinus sp. BICA1-9 TaxID=1531958 RepID=UPI00054B53D5|nr:helix-turn-helix domain-containing protein [Desulfosporosinus sp. BICA1-9]KJS48919.1 MAG: hypothetical protein VR66_11070 [Peptococcaceae bacterium BRH_c23]KJS82997.1 MAG: hypothetical protein JL57_23395 [Desulfosporosinus sp. BICA1-9]HBW37572.1 hypothetical protein [Desulfosporosinus sp.]
MINIIYAVPENHGTVDRIVRTKANKDVKFELVKKVDIEDLIDSFVLSTNNQITVLEVKEIFDSPIQTMTVESDQGDEMVEKKKRLTRQETAEMLGISRTTLWRKSKQNQ